MKEVNDLIQPAQCEGSCICTLAGGYTRHQATKRGSRDSRLGGWYTIDLMEVFACVRPSRTIMTGANPNLEGTIYIQQQRRQKIF